MKLVINSCHGYKLARTHLFKSLLATSFSDFDSVILVQGKCEADREPYRIPIGEIADVDDSREIVAIDVRINNFDLNGYHALFKHRWHPAVQSDSYFYCLDTCAFHEHFVHFFKTFRIPTAETIVTTRFPNSNISVFGQNVVHNYKQNFDSIVGKTEGLLIEHGKDLVTEEGRHVRPLAAFGTVKLADNRRFRGVADPYATGHKRRVYHYPSFGVDKYILWSRTGDLSEGGKVTRLYFPRKT